jgi:protein O-mannosyl-transferase
MKGEETMSTSREILNSEATRHNNLTPILICLALTIIMVITFWSLKDCGFINFDDPDYVYENAYVQSGLKWNSIRQAFSFSSELVEISVNWFPLTWLSLMLDYQIFGLNPQGFHLTNLLFHVLNTILLFLIFHRMTKTLWPSAFVAALFAIHPLHVESVAWITERKDVLSTFFWMLTMGAYSYYVEHREFRRYFFVLLFFVFGLMSKPMLVTLPFVLLLLDYWPLKRFQEIKPDHKVQPEELKKPSDSGYKWSLIYPLILEKVPFFILAILSSIVTYIAQQKGGAVHSEAIPLGVRIGNAFVSYITYIGKMIWPINLAVFYPHPEVLIFWQVWGAVFLIISITSAVIWIVKKIPYLVTGWFWYVGTLVPVIGIVQAGGQAMADRYTYIPLIGLFIMVAWGIPDLLKKWNHRKEILLVSSVLSILCLSIITWTQVCYWQNSITLLDHTLNITDHNWLIYLNRGNAYAGLGNYGQAIDDYSKAIEIKPYYIEAYNDRGLVYNALGNYNQAIQDYDRAIEINPVYADAYNNRGIVYSHLGNYKQAIEDYSRVIEINPKLAKAYNNRGLVYLTHGDKKSGCYDARKAYELGNRKLLETAKTRGLCR